MTVETWPLKNLTINDALIREGLAEYRRLRDAMDESRAEGVVTSSGELLLGRWRLKFPNAGPLAALVRDLPADVAAVCKALDAMHVEEQDREADRLLDYLDERDAVRPAAKTTSQATGDF